MKKIKSLKMADLEDFWADILGPDSMLENQGDISNGTRREEKLTSIASESIVLKNYIENFHKTRSASSNLNISHQPHKSPSLEWQAEGSKVQERCKDVGRNVWSLTHGTEPNHIGCDLVVSDRQVKYVTSGPALAGSSDSYDGYEGETQSNDILDEDFMREYLAMKHSRVRARVFRFVNTDDMFDKDFEREYLSMKHRKVRAMKNRSEEENAGMIVREGSYEKSHTGGNFRDNKESSVYNERQCSSRALIQNHNDGYVEESDESAALTHHDTFQEAHSESRLSAGDVITKTPNNSLPQKSGHVSGEDDQSCGESRASLSPVNKAHIQHSRYSDSIRRAAKAIRRIEKEREKRKEKDRECSVCYKVFASVQGKQHHMRTHRKDRPYHYQCDVCGKSFMQRLHLDIHKETHVDNKMYICHVCGKAIRTHACLRAHLQIHRDTTYHCDMCGKKLSSRMSMVRHLRNYHVDVDHYKMICDLCGQRFVSYNSLLIHKGRVHAAGYPCQLCGRLFSDESGLQSHAWVHTLENPFSCELCGHAFGTKFNLQRHKYWHMNRERSSNKSLAQQPEHVCNVCGLNFYQAGKLLLHMNLHSDDKRFQCTQCGKRFSNTGHLRKHEQNHSLQKGYEKRFFCDLCPRAFYSLKYFNRHRETHKFKVSFTCNVCGQEFKRRGALTRHGLKHSEVRPHVCEVCGIRFKCKAVLQKHMSAHSDARPFACDVCGKTFKWRTVLNTHKRIHSDKPFFTCDLCGKTFKWTSTYNAHKKTHKCLS